MDYTSLLEGIQELLLHDPWLIEGRERWNIVGFAIGKKIVAHRRTGITALVVYVKRKLPPTELDQNFLVRSRIKIKHGGYQRQDVYQVEMEYAGLYDPDSIPTDVQEVGEYPQFHQLTGRYRPLVGGCSISYRDEVHGTLGCFVRSSLPGKGQYVYLLSAGHVLAPNHLRPSLTKNHSLNPSDAIIQPASIHGGSPYKPQDCIAQTFFANPLFYGVGGSNTLDAGIAQVTNGIDEASYMISEIEGLVGTGEPEEGMIVRKCGMRTGYSVGEIIGLQGTFDMLDPTGPKPDPYATMKDMIVTTVMSKPGDSGAVLVDIRNRAVGLLIGGTDTHTYFSKFSNIEQALSISLY